MSHAMHKILKLNILFGLKQTCHYYKLQRVENILSMLNDRIIFIPDKDMCYTSEISEKMKVGLLVSLL